jgi:putative endonuclease
MAQWEVYIIETGSGKLYTGITNDMEKRFRAHQTSKKGAKFFRLSSPEKILYREKCKDRSEASKRECAIKKMTRNQKLTLISSQFMG